MTCWWCHALTHALALIDRLCPGCLYWLAQHQITHQKPA